MVVTYKRRKTTLDEKACKKLSFEDFETMCLGFSTFKLMQAKVRNAKIKECYGKLHPNATKVQKPRLDKDIHDSDVKSVGRDSGAKPGSVDVRKDIAGKEDKAKIQKQGVSEKDQE